MSLNAHGCGHHRIGSGRVITKFRVINHASSRAGIVGMYKRIAVVGGWVANILGIRGNDIEFIGGNVVAQHVPAVVAYPQVAGLGVPVHANNVANALRDNFVGSRLRLHSQ